MIFTKLYRFTKNGKNCQNYDEAPNEHWIETNHFYLVAKTTDVREFNTEKF